jgi:hypothetical protein
MKDTDWAVYKGEEIIFNGTFIQCWAHMMNVYGRYTLRQLCIMQIAIKRSS